MPKKILVYGLHDHLGGLERYIRNLVDYGATDGVTFDFVTVFPEMVYEQEYLARGFQVFHISDFKKNPSAFLRDSVKIMERGDYNAVYYQMMSAANVLPLMAGAKAHVPKVVAHAHNNGLPASRFRRILHSVNRGLRLAPKYATDLWTNSGESAAWMFGPSEKALLIQNAVDTYSLAYDKTMRNAIRDELGLSDKFIMGNIGRFAEQKNHPFLIQTFAQLHRLRPDSHLILIGKGEGEQNIRRMVNELGLERHVSFLGEKANVSDYYQAMDVFVLPSLFDGLPLVLLEAQAAGLATFSSDVIPATAGFLPNFRQMSLDQGPESWAQEIAKIGDYDRNDMSLTMQGSPAEIRNQAPKIINLLTEER